MEKFFINGKLAALRISTKGRKPGSNPVSEKSSALQVLVLKHFKGDSAKPHRHIIKKRVTNILQECLVVIRGKIRVELFDKKECCAESFIVRAGEAALLLGAPHALYYLEDTEIIEAKNGPFIDDKEFL